MARTLARALVLFALPLWLVLASACSRPGEKRCTEVCEHYLDLYIAAQYDQKLAEAKTPGERAELDKKRADEREALRNDPARGFDQCVNRCNRRSRGDVADCMMKAETLDKAKGCEPEDDVGCSAGARPEDSPLALGAILLALVAIVRRGRGRSPRAAR